MSENIESSESFVIPKSIGDYEIFGIIGRGTFAEVHSAWDTRSAIRVCVKIIPKPKGDDYEFDLLHQIREIKTLKELNHPNIVNFLDVYDDDKYYYIFMEYLTGQSLIDMVNNQGPLSNNVALYIFKQILSALAYLHTIGIAHRDLKLENIIVDEVYHVKLIDFGFCSDVNEHNKMLTTFCGSFLYVSPEILRAEPYNGFAADMWSSGVILYAMVCGCLPFDVESVPRATDQILNAKFDIEENINPLCENLIRALICKDPLARLTAKEALRHPWLNNHEKSAISTSLPSLAAVKIIGLHQLQTAGKPSAQSLNPSVSTSKMKKVGWETNFKSLAIASMEREKSRKRRRRSSFTPDVYYSKVMSGMTGEKLFTFNT